MKLFALALLVACGGSKPAPVRESPDRELAHRSTCAEPRIYGVVPFKDKTGSGVDVSGMDELLAVELTKDPCVVVVERARLQPIIDEIAHCDPDNPDRAQFDCDTFAPSGKILGVQYMMFGDLVLYEPSIAGTELMERTRHSLDPGKLYGAMAVAMRAVSVETGEVVAAETIESIVPADEGKLAAHSVPSSVQAGSSAVHDLIRSAAGHFHVVGHRSH